MIEIGGKRQEQVKLRRKKKAWSGEYNIFFSFFYI